MAKVRLLPGGHSSSRLPNKLHLCEHSVCFFNNRTYLKEQMIFKGIKIAEVTVQRFKMSMPPQTWIQPGFLVKAGQCLKFKLLTQFLNFKKFTKQQNSLTVPPLKSICVYIPIWKNELFNIFQHCEFYTLKGEMETLLPEQCTCLSFWSLLPWFLH